MRIKELAEKYNMNPRTIDYYTKLGLIDYERDNENNNYRDYGEKAESTLLKITILRDVGLSERKIKEALQDPSFFTTKKWNELIEQMEAKVNTLKYMIKRAESIRDTKSRTLGTVNKFQNRIQWEMFTMGMAKGMKTAEAIMKEDNESDAVNDVLEKAYGFGIKMENKMSKGFGADSPEVQNLVEKFLFRIVEDYYGTMVHMIYSSCVDYLPEMLAKDEEMTEDEISALKQMLKIGAEWFSNNKGIKECADLERFKIEYKDQIAEMDAIAKESTTEGFEDLITEICLMPNTITGDSLREYSAAFEAGLESAIEAGDASKEEKSKLKQVYAFIAEAILFFFSNSHENIVDETLFQVTEEK